VLLKETSKFHRNYNAISILDSLTPIWVKSRSYRQIFDVISTMHVITVTLEDATTLFVSMDTTTFL